MKKIIIYTTLFAFLVCLAGCAGNKSEKSQNDSTVKDLTEIPNDCNAQSTIGKHEDQIDNNKDGVERDEIELLYAEEFTIESYKGCRLLTIGNEDRFLVVPEGTDTPDDIENDVIILKQPLNNAYLVSSSAMDLVCSIDAVSSIRLTGTKEGEWYVEKARAAMQSGDMLYAGKYNTPDYELILGSSCDIAIENTMIYHNPETKEKLEQLGIPVLVERSSYESDPRGRLEWIKLYGVLFGKEQEAERIFDDAMGTLDTVLNEKKTEKTVAYFYITANGYVSVRKSRDYIAKLIGMAGGRYIFDDLAGEDENALSTVNMQVEEFYASAKDADVLIYNSTIAGELEDRDELIEMCPVLSDFKAMKNGDVYCTGNNFFQKTCSMAEFAVEVNAILRGTADNEMEFLYKLN